MATAPIPLVAGLVAMLIVGSNLGRLRGTTLLAPAKWTLFSLASISIMEAALQCGEPTAASTWRYLAAITTLCPTMALLGAKRPQDRGWQFIVASLWIVLALPAAQNLAFSPGGPFELHPAWQWFLMILIGVGLANQLPTRFGIGAMLTATAQVVLLGEQLPVFRGMNREWLELAAIPMIAVALALAWILSRKTQRSFGWDQVWLDFRDQFGAVWALRVVERVNHAGRLHDWPSRLTWKGFVAAADDSDSQGVLSKEMELSVRTLLRRFVSPEWIDARLKSDRTSEQ